MIKVPYRAFPMQVVYSTDVPIARGKIEWKSATWLSKESREAANEWLADRFGRTPCILLFEEVFVMHPAHRQYVEEIRGAGMAADDADLLISIAWYLILPAIGLGTVIYWTGSFLYWLFT